MRSWSSSFSGGLSIRKILGLPNALGKMSSFYLWAVLTTVEDWQTLAVLGDVA
jgi:hypothetical protein